MHKWGRNSEFAKTILRRKGMRKRVSRKLGLLFEHFISLERKLVWHEWISVETGERAEFGLMQHD